jgi:pimeloyl-ACP methyl ester carboxylesterase
VALIGHSEGAMSAVLLAERMPRIAAVVLMAGPGRPIDVLLAEQLLDARRKSGAGPEELGELEAQIAGFLASVKEGRPIDAAALPPELAVFVPARAWLSSHLLQDPLANLRKLRCPVLILQGERDVQVSAERDAPPLLAALRDAGNEDCELVIFPGLDHLFKRVPGETASELDYLKSRPVDAEFLEALSTWLRERLLKAS